MTQFSELFPDAQIDSTLSNQLGRSHFVEMFARDLKIGKFSAADKGQMELYLRWLEKHEREPGEETPLGLILCADKSDEQVELLQLDQSGIRVATYLTELPPRALLHQKLHEAMTLARGRLEIPRGD